MITSLRELATAGCSVTISASELLRTISIIRQEEREAAIKELKTYTIKDVVSLTGISENGIRKAIRRGSLPMTQPLGEGTTVFIPADAVHNLIYKLQHGEVKNL